MANEANELSAPHVLVVDDDADVCSLLSRELRELGYETDVACCAAAGQAAIQTQEYAVVLTDVRMPGMDGLSFASWVRAHTPSTEVIMMTAFASMDDAVSAMRAGAGDYLVKHLADLEAIRVAVRAAAQRHLTRRTQQHIHDQLQDDVASLVQLLDHVPVGVALLDRGARPRIANAPVRELLDRRDGLTLGPDGSLRTEDRSTNEQIRALLHALAQHSSQAGGAWTAGRESNDEPLHLVLSPLRPGQSSSAVAALIVHDPTRPCSAPESLLQRVHGLTPAEASLASVMMQGCPIEQAADQLGVSVNTAKTHLKRVFSKTGVTRQAELVYLLLTGPALFSIRE
jgi:DNA-binding NarL/FixJ family response regulator